MVGFAILQYPMQPPLPLDGEKVILAIRKFAPYFWGKCSSMTTPYLAFCCCFFLDDSLTNHSGGSHFMNTSPSGAHFCGRLWNSCSLSFITSVMSLPWYNLWRWRSCIKLAHLYGLIFCILYKYILRVL